MSVIWVSAAAGAVGAIVATLILRKRKPKSVIAFADPREERLARQVARSVGCLPEDALPAVRRELEYSPGQSDDTLVKRAVYHYRQDVPERTCSTWRDASPG